LLEAILATVELPADHHFGLEAHPGTTSREQLELLPSMGFNRLSIGIQDFAPEILEIINRKQSRAEVEQCTQWARELGFRSLNFDLIFGLPLQTPEHIYRTMEEVQELRPDRIAFYSYAHVPWIKPSQRAYSESDLPTGAEKRALYELGRRQLEESGYREIGLDHFALPEDSLAQALKAGRLHRNFMGYTPFATPLCLALGASSIADSGSMFIQNEKSIETYQDRISQNEFPILKGHNLSREDRVIRHHILNLMCRGRTSWALPARQHPALEAGLMRMEEFLKDGLIEITDCELKVTPAGKPFIRNLALALDARYWKKKPEGKLFSQVV
jgi:oxygen-independent coproporphyrinogen-3 oxidase